MKTHFFTIATNDRRENLYKDGKLIQTISTCVGVVPSEEEMKIFKQNLEKLYKALNS